MDQEGETIKIGFQLIPPNPIDVTSEQETVESIDSSSP